jgi:hypothetical protein
MSSDDVYRSSPISKESRKATHGGRALISSASPLTHEDPIFELMGVALVAIKRVPSLFAVAVKDAEVYWRDATRISGKTTAEYDYPTPIVSTIRLLYALASHEKMSDRRLRDRLCHSLACNFSTLSTAFKEHELHPYFLLFSSEVNDDQIYELRNRRTKLTNDLVDRLRSQLSSPSVVKKVKEHEAKARKSVKIVDKYVRWLKGNFQDLKLARLELRNPSDQFAGNSAHTVKNALASLMDGLGKILTKVGHLSRLDYAPSKGYYVMLLVLFDPNDARDEAALAEVVGKLWQNKAIKTGGIYTNLSQCTQLAKDRGRTSIATRWEALEAHAMFFGKLDFFARLRRSGLGKTLVVGQKRLRVKKSIGAPKKRARTW